MADGGAPKMSGVYEEINKYNLTIESEYSEKYIEINDLNDFLRESVEDGATHFKVEEYHWNSSAKYYRIKTVKNLTDKEVKDIKRAELLKQLAELDEE